jgi:hypothetical protein
MNYADALDQNQQSDRAWRLRRHLLSAEWQAAQGGRTLHAARQRWLTEAWTKRGASPGPPAADPAPGRHRPRRPARTAALDRRGHGRYSNAAAETAIGWLQDRAEYSAERASSGSSTPAAGAAKRPLWAEITVALAEQDKAASGQLLERFDDSLSRYDRVNAARLVDDLRLAQSAAFETQSEQTDDDPTHQQLTETLLAFSHHAGLDITQRKRWQHRRTGQHGTPSPGDQPTPGARCRMGRIARTVRDNNVFAAAPDEEWPAPACSGGKPRAKRCSASNDARASTTTPRCNSPSACASTTGSASISPSAASCPARRASPCAWPA